MPNYKKRVVYLYIAEIFNPPLGPVVYKHSIPPPLTVQ